VPVKRPRLPSRSLRASRMISLALPIRVVTHKRNKRLRIGGVFLSGPVPDAFDCFCRERRSMWRCRFMACFQLAVPPADAFRIFNSIWALIHVSFLLIFHIVCSSSNSGRFLQREHIHVSSNSSGRGLPQNTHRASGSASAKRCCGSSLLRAELSILHHSQNAVPCDVAKRTLTQRVFVRGDTHLLIENADDQQHVCVLLRANAIGIEQL
jgi:hypothetical protein